MLLFRKGEFDTGFLELKWGKKKQRENPEIKWPELRVFSVYLCEGLGFAMWWWPVSWHLKHLLPPKSVIALMGAEAWKPWKEARGPRSRLMQVWTRARRRSEGHEASSPFPVSEYLCSDSKIQEGFREMFIRFSGQYHFSSLLLLPRNFPSPVIPCTMNANGDYKRRTDIFQTGEIWGSRKSDNQKSVTLVTNKWNHCSYYNIQL